MDPLPIVSKAYSLIFQEEQQRVVRVQPSSFLEGSLVGIAEHSNNRYDSVHFSAASRNDSKINIVVDDLVVISVGD